ncbi:MAG: SpoIIE family protein phosphatase [Lachnospiraceae bacterium]|nr:SpoIIE family protein phosphatase [Lachnospiraceae bacterium]
MRIYKKLTVGGIESKILVLLCSCILLISGAFFIASVFQGSQLAKINADTNKRQMDSLTEFSKEMIEDLVMDEMSRSTELEATITNNSFKDMQTRIKILAKYAQPLLENPENASPAKWSFPERSKNGQLCTMVMLADELDANAPEVNARISLVANMSDMMIAICSAFNAENVYIALPEGILLSCSRSSGGWYEEDGTLQSYDPRTRFWYKDAVEAKKLIFTDIGDDKETGQLCITSAMPVYGKNQELLAVVGTDHFLSEIQKSIETMAVDDEFQIILNHNGEVIFSPMTSGELMATGITESESIKAAETIQPFDLRESDNSELAAFVTDTMLGKTETKRITLSSGTYYMSGAPVRSIGWTEISVFSQLKADELAVLMLDSYAKIQKEADASYQAGKRSSTFAIFVVLIVEIALLIWITLKQGRRIVQPLNNITNRISELTEGDMEFFMTDDYRTGDEIQVLAESFQTLTHKTVDYVKQVKQVSAEKERISTELRMANQIQDSMLPNTFPAFPDCTAIDIYATMTPAKEVGGDFYDFFFIDPNHLAMVIADVSGKGIPAALFMMISRTVIKNCAMLGRSAGQILEDSNRTLCSENKMEMFVTAWIGILDLRSGWLTTANAGHEYPAVYRTRIGKFGLLKDKHGLVLGGIENVRYKEYEFRMEPGDKIFVYTDGVVEAENGRHEFFGTDRLIKALNRVPHAGPEAVLASVRNGVGDFVGDEEQFDDLTMLCLEYRGY